MVPTAFLGPESIELPFGPRWKLVGNIESELLALVPSRTTARLAPQSWATSGSTGGETPGR